MPDDTQPSSLRPVALTISLDPSSISLDEHGRVQLKDARVLQAILTASAPRPTRAASREMLSPGDDDTASGQDWDYEADSNNGCGNSVNIYFCAKTPVE